MPAPVLEGELELELLALRDVREECDILRPLAPRSTAAAGVARCDSS